MALIGVLMALTAGEPIRFVFVILVVLFQLKRLEIGFQEILSFTSASFEPMVASRVVAVA